MRRRLLIGTAVMAIVLSGLFVVYWLDPNRVIWTRDGTVATVHQYADPKNVPNWNVLVFIYQTNNNGFLTDTGYVALNGAGTPDHGNFCWSDGSDTCLDSPLTFSVNQTLTVTALNNGHFMVANRHD